MKLRTLTLATTLAVTTLAVPAQAELPPINLVGQSAPAQQTISDEEFCELYPQFLIGMYRHKLAGAPLALARGYFQHEYENGRYTDKQYELIRAGVDSVFSFNPTWQELTVGSYNVCRDHLFGR